MVSALTDLPEPDSPTMPSVEPLSTEYDSPLTAPTKPSSVLKPTRRSWTSSSATMTPRLDSGDAHDGREDHEGQRDDGRDALELLIEAEARPVIRLDASADRAAQTLLFGRLER